jgi:asparaginyl-tRNA synthetase
VVTLQEDPKLPASTLIKIRDCSKYENKRVKVNGWAHHIRNQKKIIFIELRDGTSFLQCVLSGKLAHPSLAENLRRECSLSIVGTLTRPPPEKHVPGDFELQADYWTLVGPSSADLENLVNVVSFSALFHYLIRANIYIYIYIKKNRKKRKGERG